MNKQLLLEKLAKLAVNVGINIQKGQPLVINAPIAAQELVRLTVHEAYLAGSGKVFVNWSDDQISKDTYQFLSVEQLSEVPDFVVDRLRYFIDNKAAFLSIISPNPYAFQGVDPKKIAFSSKAMHEKTSFYSDAISASRHQWSIIAYPNEVWCKKVFPNDELEVAYDKLFEAIMKTSRISENNDPVEDWDLHIKELEKHFKLLNEYNFKSLHFKNSLGTDLKVELIKDHIWAGGAEATPEGVIFVPNIPTEEVFTMPDKYGVNGKVVSTKPLLYQGVLIEDFWFEFKDGKVIDFNASSGYETLKLLVEADEGSSRLGEVALISHNSPISNLNILFCNTLFDENASCHLALGNAYSMNLKNGTTMSEEEYKATNANISMKHVDFMFGSSDMEIIGTTYDGKEIQVFRKGNFVI